ncbi:MAG: hypothetical protein K8F59_14915 [Rhodobacteraceae bacterium]|nr:hypothetical protein [Paracoccaceae bacterium]
MTHIAIKSGSRLAVLAVLAVLAALPAGAQTVNPWRPQAQEPVASTPDAAAPKYYAAPQASEPAAPGIRPGGNVYAPADLDRRLSEAAPVPAPMTQPQTIAPPAMTQGGFPYGGYGAQVPPGQPVPGYGPGYAQGSGFYPGGYGYGNGYGPSGGYGGAGWPGPGGFAPGISPGFGMPFAGFAPFGIW